VFLHVQIPENQQIQQTPHVLINNNIPTTPIKPRLGQFNDVPAEDDKSKQNLTLIFAMIDNLD